MTSSPQSDRITDAGIVRAEATAGISEREPYVSAEEVAAYLNITRRQVLEMTRRGTIPGYPLGTGSSRRVWRYKLTEIDSVISGKREMTPEHPVFGTANPGKIIDGSPRNRKGRL
jgi:excisionase family DNA binding protein